MIPEPVMSNKCEKLSLQHLILQAFGKKPVGKVIQKIQGTEAQARTQKRKKNAYQQLALTGRRDLISFETWGWGC